MAFELPTYHAPDFTQEHFLRAPVPRTKPCPSDGVVPDNFHATSNLPEYVQVSLREWALCWRAGMCLFDRLRMHSSPLLRRLD